MCCVYFCCFFFSSRRRHTRCALVTGVQTCALPICEQVNIALRQSFERNRAAIDAAMLSQGVATSGIAGPDGCILCGNTIEVRGYDCWACECAAKIGRASCRERVCQYV